MSIRDKLSIQATIGILLGVMLIVAAVNVGAVYYYIDQSETVSNSVNTAGEQRMLTQRMARFSAEIATGGTADASRDSLRSAMERYQANLERLENGGTDGGVTLQPAPASVQPELTAEKQAWDEYRANIETLLTADPESEEFQQSFGYVQSNSDPLLQTSDELVTAFATESTETMGFMQQLLVALLAVDVVVFGVSILYVRRTLSTPIRQLADAADALAKGDFGAAALQQVDTSDAGTDDGNAVNNEVAMMTGSFGQLQRAIEGTFDELQQVSNGLEAGKLDSDVRTDWSGTYGDVMRSLSTGIGQLNSSFEEIRTVSEGLQEGTIDQSIDADQPGEYGDVLNGLDSGTNQLSESFEQISTASQGLKNGRLDQDLSTDYPGAYGTVLTDFADGINQLEDSIRRVEEIATEVTTASTEAANSSAEVEQASQQVAESVEEISHGADTQNENLGQVAREMNDMSATVEEIASSAAEVAATAGTAADRSETGREHASKATEEINAIETQADQAATQVEELDEEMKQIGDVVEMIAEIAEQTSMLALNASIEAARAGEAGEGFGVVASEIKSLAGDAADATDEIDERITGIQSRTTETVDGMQQMRDRVDRGAETIEEAITMFDEVAESVQEAENGIREISDATDDQAASSEEVVSMVDEVSSVSEQTAAEASNVSAATEEQTASLSEVSGTVQHLSELAADLDTQVSDFETGGGMIDAGSGRGEAEAVADGGESSEATHRRSDGGGTRGSQD